MSILFFNHKRLVYGILLLAFTYILSILFISIQINEFITSITTIKNIVSSSIFFYTTGLHGLHVLIGSCLLISLYVISSKLVLSKNVSHSLFNKDYLYKNLYLFHIDNKFSIIPQATIFYWHFVDIIWHWFHLVLTKYYKYKCSIFIIYILLFL